MPSTGTQARLPGTLPTTAQAKAALRMAVAAVKEKGNVVDGMKARFDTAKEDLAEARLKADEAEADLLATDEDSPAGAAADAAHGKACKRLEQASGDIAKVKASRKLAKAELREAEKRLESARADMEAIREGRRG